MAEEPQPSTVHEGIDPDSNQSEQPPVPKGGDSAKAAAALSSLDARSSAAAEDARKPPSAADQKALDEAMSRLEVLDAGVRLGSEKDKAGGTGGAGAGSGGAEGKEKEKTPRQLEKERKEKEAEERKKIKVDAADVALLVEQCELSKARATDLLKACRGDAVRALTEFVRAGV